MDTTHRYGYARQKALAAQIAVYERVTVEHIVLGAGSTEVLNASALANTESDKLGSVVASVSLRQTELHNFCRAKAKEGRQLVFDLCDELGLEYGRGAGNFVAFNPGIPHDEFRASMRARGVDTARPFPPRRDWARVTMGTTEEMRIFAEVLREVIAS